MVSYRHIYYGIIMLLFVSTLSAVAATNNVDSSAIALQQIAITANSLKPTQCANLNPTRIVKGAGIVTGSSENELILGSPGVDTINGGSGDDCLIGGGGIDVLIGGPGNDVCIGSSAAVTFDISCERHFP